VGATADRDSLMVEEDQAIEVPSPVYAKQRSQGFSRLSHPTTTQPNSGRKEAMSTLWQNKQSVDNRKLNTIAESNGSRPSGNPNALELVSLPEANKTGTKFVKTSNAWNKRAKSSID